MPGKVRVGGAWKDVSAINTRVGGSWKTVTEGWTKVAGVWKQWYSSFIEPRTAPNLFLEKGIDISSNEIVVWDRASSSKFVTINLDTLDYTDRVSASYTFPQHFAKGNDGTIMFTQGASGSRTVVRSTDSLNTFTTVRSGLLGVVAVTTNGTGQWIVAYNGNDLWHSSNNGDTWTSILNVFGSRLITGLAFLPGVGYIAFDGNANGYYTSTNGTTWTLRTFPFTLFNHGNSDLMPFTVVGGYVYACSNVGTALGIWRSSDLINWTNTGQPFSAYSGVLFYPFITNDGTNVYVIGFDFFASPRNIYAFKWNGTSWTPAEFADGVTSITMAASGTGAISAQAGSYYAFYDGTNTIYGVLE
jgi:hypothetical protein